MMSDRIYQYYDQIKSRLTVADPVALTALGGHNELVVYPNVMIQSMTNHDDNVTTLTASGHQAIQIIKLTHDNIRLMRFMAAITTATSTIYETFDYADDTALRAVWTSNAAARIQCHNDKTIVATGTSSMRMTTANNTAVGFYIQRDLGSATNFSSASYTNLKMYARKNTSALTMNLTFVDMDGLSSSALIGAGIDTWLLVEKNHNSFIANQATATDFSRIRYIRFVVVANTTTNQSFWVDQMVFLNAATGDNLNIRLYDCGPVMPTASSTIGDWTLLTSDKGRTTLTSSVSLLEEVGHNTIEINDPFGLVYGATKLTVGNYLAVVMSWAADNIGIAGLISSSSPYANGKFFTSAG
jgi:hypothetical protein